MHRLAKLGFTQSYTYFTWRNTKHELVEYFTELAHGPGREYLPAERVAEHARHPHRVSAARRPRGVRAPAWCSPRRSPRATASTARRSSSLEREPREPGTEEYLDSEKYQLRHWELDRAGQPRAADRAHQPHPAREPGAAVERQPALPATSTTTQLLCVLKHSRRRRERDRDRGQPRSAPSAVGLGRRSTSRRWASSRTRRYQMHDLLSGARYLWQRRGATS